MNTPNINEEARCRGGCGHSDKQVEFSALSFGACFIAAVIFIGAMVI